jgi:Flp pilus assembly protein TadD
MGRFSEAVASFDQAIALEPNYVQPHVSRGTAFQQLGRNAEKSIVATTGRPNSS